MTKWSPAPTRFLSPWKGFRGSTWTRKQEITSSLTTPPKPEVLTQNATLMALTAFWIADRPERFASPWPAEKTAKMLREQGEYEELKAFGLWKYGDLGLEQKKD